MTQWEYGPGSLWALHYGADEVTGIVFDADLTPNRFLQQATAGNFIGVEARPISGAYVANAAESLTLTKLNSTDGTVIESALMVAFSLTATAGLTVGIFSEVQDKPKTS